MEGNNGSSRNGQGIEFEEENILAIVNASGAKHTNDANEDRISFLGAVRAVSILSVNGIPPTGKILQEVFRILRIGKTLELIMASHQLLEELDKSFPRVRLSGNDTVPELVVVKKDWTPILVSTEVNAGHREASNDKDGALDSYGFQLLIQELVESVDETNIQECDIESMRKLLLFQYLANVLENDFVPRNIAYEGTTEWCFIKESLLNMLLGSRRLNFKSLVKECLAVMCRLYEISASFGDDDMMNQESGLVKSTDDLAVLIALPEVRKNACIALQKFFTMVMKLDESKKKADLEGFTTRSDGIRTPTLELILDELTYDSDTLHLFLQVYEEPKWKLEIVVQYLWKYIAKPSVRTRRSNGPTDNDVTFRGALKCLSNISSTRSTVKKIGAEELQLLIGHGFQASLSLPSKLSDTSKESTSYSLVELCRDVISAFKSLTQAEKNMEILPFGKETLFTAATIISTKL